MHRRFARSAAFLVICFMMIPIASSAIVQTINCPTNPNLTCAIGIMGLTVGSATYDVSFAGGSFNELDDGINFPFLGDQSAAETARSAVADALNASPAESIWFGGSLGVDSITFWIPYSSNVDLLQAQNRTGAAGGWNSFSTFLNGDSVGSGPWTTFVPVPIPGVIWLFASALGVLGLVRRMTA